MLYIMNIRKLITELTDQFEKKTESMEIKFVEADTDQSAMDKLTQYYTQMNTNTITYSYELINIDHVIN